MSVDSSQLSAARAAPAPEPRAAQPAAGARASAVVATSSPVAAGVSAGAPQPPEPVDLGFDPAEVRRTIDEAVDQLNDMMRRNGRNLAFQVDDAVNRTVITVRSTHTGEVVRQIPEDVVLRVAHNIEDMKGLMLNARA